MSKARASAARQATDFTPLHPLEFQILLCLKEVSAHAYAVAKSIEEREGSHARVQPTNLYRRIWRLEKDGLLLQVASPKNSDSDPRRKYLAITEFGIAVAEAETTRLTGLLARAEEVGIRPAEARS